MKRLIAKDYRNQQRIFPYLGGEELNTSPTHSHHRYVIHFGSMSESDARQWPDLMRIVEERVRPERLKKSKEVASWPWWQFWRVRGELSSATAGLNRVLAIARVSQYANFAFVHMPVVPSEQLVVLPFSNYAPFSTLQSRIHEIWARFFGSSLEDRLRYTPSDCFETFPFPPGWESDARLEEAGRVYYEFRAALMIRNDEGLTKTYNRFHDRNERDPDILKLRALHADMDRAVLAAYGWTDIATDCDFYLDYEIDEASWGDKKKPYRYRFPDAVRDDLLAAPKWA
jgi:hypothetical protein